MNTPNFIVIGGQRCGTSTLHGHLQQHPGIYLPWSRKEIHYFDRYFDKGPQWYAAYFKNQANKQKGEVTPAYLYHDACAQRIHQMNPEVKLIAVLRNPMERAYSQFKLIVRETGYRRDFSRFLADHPDALARGLYYQQLQRYLRLFPMENIKVVLFDDLIRKPASVMRQLFGFIGVDTDFTPERLQVKENAGQIPRCHKLYVLTKTMTAKLHDYDLSWVIALGKALRMRRVFFRTKPANLEFSPINEAHRRSLVDYYKTDLAELAGVLGKDLGHWCAS